MATQHALDGKRSATPPTKLDHSLSRVFRAAWTKSTRVAKKRGNELLVSTKQGFHGALGHCHIHEWVYQLISSFLPRLPRHDHRWLDAVPGASFASVGEDAGPLSAR